MGIDCSRDSRVENNKGAKDGATISCECIGAGPNGQEHCDVRRPRLTNVYVEVGEIQESECPAGDVTIQPGTRDGDGSREVKHAEFPRLTESIRQVQDRDDGGWVRRRSVEHDHKRQELPQWLDCMMRRTVAPTRGNLCREDMREEQDFEDDMQRLCPMTGEFWEQFPYPIIVDSGACTSVMPSKWCTHVPLKCTPQSKISEYFEAANGE